MSISIILCMYRNRSINGKELRDQVSQFSNQFYLTSRTHFQVSQKVLSRSKRREKQGRKRYLIEKGTTRNHGK